MTKLEEENSGEDGVFADLEKVNKASLEASSMIKTNVLIQAMMHELLARKPCIDVTHCRKTI